jgi:deoxyadenosine/deoxycytidine kinase
MKKSPQKFFISLEGNTGAGKSTLACLLRDSLGASEEPFEQWNALNTSGDSLFETFQSNSSRWAFSFQSYAFLSYMQELHKVAWVKNKSPLIITDRSPYTGMYCFTKMFYDDDRLNQAEWNIYQEITQWLVTKISFKPQGFVYLQTPPEMCYERNTKRNRPTRYPLKLEFFERLGRYHDEWLLEKNFPDESFQNIPVLVLDGTLNFEEDKHVQTIFVDNVNTFIQSLVAQQTIF